jgi:hypothetical protein
MDVFSLVVVLATIALIAAGVTVADAARAAHWRDVAVQRRRSWDERLECEPLPNERLPVRDRVH